MLPTGIHFKTYGSEAGLLKTTRARVWVALLVAGLALLPLVSND
jgi:branched-chain amino acid transport system permease protein